MCVRNAIARLNAYPLPRHVWSAVDIHFTYIDSEVVPKEPSCKSNTASM